MGGLDIDISTGVIRAIAFNTGAGVNANLVTGECDLLGWSMRDTHGLNAVDGNSELTSPGAGSTIVTLSGINSGLYTLNWEVGLAGTVANTDANNFQIANSVAAIAQSINPGAVGTWAQNPMKFTMVPSDSITITAIAAGTAGSEYSAAFSLVPSTDNISTVEVLDGNQVVGIIGCGWAESDTEWFGPQGIRMYNQIVLKTQAGGVTGSVYARLYRPGD